MNVVKKIHGREAIPVRALPFLSDRKTMGPDVVANIFAGKDLLGRFAGLCAYRIENGAVTPIAQRWWQTGPCQKLAALSATLQTEECANETETEDEYKLRHARELAKWRDKSPGLLPAGAFVFKDEFEQIYRNEFQYGHYHFMGEDRKPLSETKHNERMALDYSPFVDSQMSTLIMAGFESYAPTAGAPGEELPASDAEGAISNQTIDAAPLEELPLAQKQKTAAPAPVEPASDVKPWQVIDPRDPPIVPPKDQPWYTPARYFARQLVVADSTLLTKRQTLAGKVSTSLAGAGIYKRGGKKPHSADTVLKAFANVTLG